MIKIGNISFYDPHRIIPLPSHISEETGKMIDEEVRKLIDIAYEKTKALLSEKKVQVEILAKELLVKEVLFQSDVETFIGKRPFEDKKHEEDDGDEDEQAKITRVMVR